MDDALTCEVCMEKFSTGQRDPLVLSCGHTYCRSCVVRIRKEEEDFVCPSCRRSLDDLEVNTFPINYKLLGLPSLQPELQFETCSTHGDALTYWCQTCQQSLCGLCLFRNHPQDHEVGKTKDVLQDKERQLEARAQKWKDDVNKWNASKMQMLMKELKTLLANEAQFSKSQKVIDELLMEIKRDFCLETIIDVETKINTLMMDTEAAGTKEVSSSHIYPNMEEKSPLGSIAQAIEVNSSTDLYCCIQNHDGKTAKVQWQDSKLLMSAFTEEPATCDLLLKMPSKVYMELSISDVYLGRVIIQPWYHLRRAQQFAALCIGTFGVSYSGTTFESVMHENLPRETLVGGMYPSVRYGGITCRELLTDLEWDGNAEGEAREGVVMGILDEYDGDSKFGICTRGQRSTYFKCPFGEVVSGLDFVKVAVQHCPVSEVTIMRCGAVLADLGCDLGSSKETPEM